MSIENHVLYSTIQEIQKNKLDVYMPNIYSSYFWFTDGTNIGYCQFDRFDGVKFSSVHKPNQYTGTGIVADNYSDALKFAPSWWGNWWGNNEQDSIIKYKDFKEFESKHWQRLIKITTI
jgi:hypothetical protein